MNLFSEPELLIGNTMELRNKGAVVIGQRMLIVYITFILALSAGAFITGYEWESTGAGASENGAASGRISPEIHCEK